MEKHPVSYLQEAMARPGKTAPFYDIKPCIGGFVCEVTVEDITTSAVCTSKSAAKFEAAYKAAISYNEKYNRNHIKIIPPPTITINNSLNDSNSSSLDTSINSSLNSSQTYMAKHPISELQEFMARKQKPLPHYSVVDRSTLSNPYFHCTLTVEGKSYEFEGPNKQITRTQCAKLALNDLSGLDKDDTGSGVTYNAVGTLNEFLQRSNFRSASFQEMGVNSKGQFLIVCEALGKRAEGCGTTKKQAKQNSAHNMIEILQIHKESEEKTRKAIINVEPTVNNDDNIIKKFTELSIQPQQLLESAMPTEKLTPGDVNIKDTSTQDDLTKLLNELGLEFSIKTLPTMDDFVVLALVINDKESTTYLCCGNNYEETRIDLLKKAYKLMSLSK